MNRTQNLPQEPLQKPLFTIRFGLLLVGILFALQVIAGGILLAVRHLLTIDESTMQQMFVWGIAVSQIGALVLCTVLISRRLRQHGKTWSAVGLQRFKFWRAVRYILGFYGIMLAFLLLLAVVAKALLGSDAAPDQSGMDDIRHMNPLMIVVLSAFLSPVLEELIFRGVLFTALLARYRVGIAVLISSLLFTFAHFDPMHMIAILPLGFYAAFMTYRLGSIYPAIILHISWNLLVSLIRL